MLKIKFPFSEIRQLAARDVAYQQEDPALRPFYQYPVQIDQFQEIIQTRKQYPVNRQVLQEVLLKQYANLEVPDRTQEQIEKLGSENTFTIVTAHQPSLFGGPLYFLYKIASAINLSRQLNERLPDAHIIPVFIVGGEDHDFEEINHLNLFGKESQVGSGNRRTGWSFDH